MFHGLDARNQADHDEEEMKLAVSYSADKERGGASRRQLGFNSFHAYLGRSQVVY